MLGHHPLHSEPCIYFVCSVRCTGLESLETCSPANMPFKKATQKEIASIQLSCKPGSAKNCHFFGTKKSILS